MVLKSGFDRFSFLVSPPESARRVRRVQLVHDFDDRHFAQVVARQVQRLDHFIVVQKHLNQASFAEFQLLLDAAVHDSVGGQSAPLQDQILQLEAAGYRVFWSYWLFLLSRMRFLNKIIPPCSPK